MKYDPIIAEQMKHLPAGRLTALAQDILRRPSPDPPPSHTRLRIIMGYVHPSQVRTEFSAGGGELQMMQKVQSPGCLSLATIWTFVAAVSLLRYWLRRKFATQKASHWQPGEKMGRERWRGGKKTVCLLSLSSDFLFLSLPCWVSALSSSWGFVTQSPFESDNRKKYWHSRHECNNAQRVSEWYRTAN